jgi:phosphoglycerol transferase MdoB-like AlkP superfamily enzyme
MTIATAVALWLFAAPVLLGLLFPLAIQYKRGGWRQIVLLITVVAMAMDVALNYTTLAIYTLDFPRAGEYTFSKRLARLIHDTGWRGAIARRIAAYLNYFDSGHVT